MKTKPILYCCVILIILFFPRTKAQTWEFVGLDSLLILHLNVEGDTIYAGTADRNNNPNLNSGLYYSLDGGSNWTQLDSSLEDGAILGLEKNIDNTIYIIKCPCLEPQAGTLYKTMDNGQSWVSIDNISNNGIRWMRISPFNSNEMYAIDVLSIFGGSLYSLFKSIDGGTNWEEIGSFPSDSHGNRVAVALDLLHDSNLYAGVSTTLIGDYFFKSTDKGNNWFYVSTPPIFPSEIYTDYFLPGRIYLYSFPQYISNNGGINWLRADSGTSANSGFLSFYQDRITTGLLYNLRTDGLYESGNDTIYWNRLEGSEYLPLDLPSGIRNLKNITIDKTSRKIYVGTSNGIYRKSVLTNLQNENNSIIKGFNLEQNFPNPFNPKTTINYHLPKSTYVTLKVYDLLGNELAILVNEKKQKGDYKVEFNGEKFSSGVYIYTLTAGAYRISKKMTHIK